MRCRFGLIFKKKKVDLGWLWIWYEGYANNRILGMAGWDCKMNCSILVFLIVSCSRIMMSTLKVQNLCSLVRAINKLRTSSLIFFSTRMLGHTLNLVWQQWWVENCIFRYPIAWSTFASWRTKEKKTYNGTRWESNEEIIRINCLIW